MASINSVSSSNLSSLYNSANTISGLASGLDTESMIEQLVKSYSTKITGLQKKSTKLEWQQEAYRSIISKMTAFSNNYTSYTSSTNLLSSGFFNSAVNMLSQGKNAEFVSATGKTSSDVRINGVSQIAKAARYETAGNLNVGDGRRVSADGSVDLTGNIELSTLSGSLTFTYGTRQVSIDFGELEIIGENGMSTEAKAQALADAIKEKLGEQTMYDSQGQAVAASEKIRVTVENGAVHFSDGANAGNSVYISGATGAIKDTLGIKTSGKEVKEQKSIGMSGVSVSQTGTTVERLSGKTMTFNLNGVSKSFTMPTIEKKEDGSYDFTINGKTSQVKAEDLADRYVNVLQSQLDKAYGTGKIQVSNLASDSQDGNLQLSFALSETGSSLSLSGVGSELLGLKNATTNLNVGKTLKDLLGDDMGGLTSHKIEAEGEVKNINGKYYDAKGNEVKVLYDDGKYYRVNKEGEYLEAYDFVLNGQTIGQYTKDTTLDTVMANINANSEAGVKVTYSNTTHSFLFSSNETGAQSKIEFGEGLAQTMFSGSEKSTIGQIAAGGSWGDGSDTKTLEVTVAGRTIKASNIGVNHTVEELIDAINADPGAAADGITASYDRANNRIVFTKDGIEQEAVYGKDDTLGAMFSAQQGADAKFQVTVNGKTMEMSRSTNSVELDGMTVTLKNTFNETFDPKEEAVTFTSKVDSDKIVDAVKSMITDYNEIMKDIKEQYGTLPYKNTDGTYGKDPLTDEDMSTMSESAIAAYEKKAKQGILFNDNMLSTLYQNMSRVFQLSGKDGATMKEMGITVNFSLSDGTMNVQLDENKLRTMLDKDPDAVKDLFTRTTANGAPSNGIMTNLKTQLDRYAGLTGASKGLLVQKAGTPLNTMSMISNELQNQIDNIQKQIEKWQDKLADQVDSYTSKFTRLELLINQMNSQSASLAGLMMGGQQ
ncbi:MAG: flagellar filament capping protein FliD [Firmicutes bacterium]|nr:flagellar filament capping protein FliD [Bacillota bacterium]